MKINRRSANITEGVARAPNRSMYYAMGYEEGDFKKPMIGVANGHSTITPCNSGLQKLADAAVAGIEAAGGNAQIFGTPTISDGMAMGTEGMKYSLVSREVIADCIETCVGGQWMDGVLVVGGCDKNMPGGMMGMLRANVPAIYVYGGTILPGRYKGQDLNIVSVFEAVGQFSAGNMGEEDFCQIERRAIPGTGSCGGMYTANTMSSAFEALGMSLPFSSTMANPHDEIVAHTSEAARVLFDADEILIAHFPGRVCADCFEGADDRQVLAFPPAWLDRAAVDVDRRDVHAQHRDHAARHVLVAAAAHQHAVHRLAVDRRLYAISNHLARNQ